MLSEKIVSVINDSSNNIYVSHASFWEMTIKKSLGKLDLITSISDFYRLVLENSFMTLNFDIAAYMVLENLPLYHQDPFDRMIISQAISESLTIITQDQKFDLYKTLVPITFN